jgi:hypothetical protein
MWREEAVTEILAGRPYQPLTAARGCYADAVIRGRWPLQNRRATVAKPVQVRHSPATVTALSGAEVRSPARRAARAFERKVRRTVRSTA